MKYLHFALAAMLFALIGCGAGHPNLTSITVTPQTATSPLQGQVGYPAMGNFSDNSSRELTQADGLSWRTSTAGATIGSTGEATCLGPGTVTVTADADAGAGPLHAAYDLVVKPHAFPTRRLTVSQAFVTPPPSERERIDRDARLLESVWRSPAGERLWTAPFVRPVPGAANSAFGTRSVFNGTARNPHGGADFLSPGGTPIRAPNGGRIAVARSLYFSGNTVVIDHGLGLFSTLAHLSVIDVHEGDVVTAGQIVGQVGATGRVTGPHLHWAVRAGGARVDPLSLLALLGS